MVNGNRFGVEFNNLIFELYLHYIIQNSNIAIQCKTVYFVTVMTDTKPKCHICGETITTANSKLQLKPESCTHFMCDDCIDDLILTDPDDEQPIYPCPFCEKRTTNERGATDSKHDHNGTTVTDNLEDTSVSKVIHGARNSEPQGKGSEHAETGKYKETKLCSDGCIFCHGDNVNPMKYQNDSSSKSEVQTVHTHPEYIVLNKCEASIVLTLRASCANGHQHTQMKQCFLCEKKPSPMSDNQPDSCEG